MSNDRIKISFTDVYPFVNGSCLRMPNLHVSSGCPRPGIFVEIITLLTNYLNLTIDVKKVVRSHQLDDTYHELYNNKIDLISRFLENSSLRAINYDFTKELYSTDIKIAIRRTDHLLTNIFDFFNIYRWDTWISIIVVFVLFTAFGLLVRYVECQLMLRERCNFAEILWKMVRFQLAQSEGIDYNLVAGRSSVFVFSLFQICIILGLFQGIILTSIVKKVNLTPFTGNEFPQLVKDKKLTIVAPSLNNWYFQEIETSYESPFYELREAFKSNPYKLIETSDDALRTVDEGNGAVAFIREGFLYSKIIAESYCNLVLVDSSIHPEKQRLMFRKGSKFVQMFDRAIDANKYLIERIKLKYSNFEHQISLKCATQNTGPTPLSIAPYYGLLVLFFVGMSSACFVFSGELLKWKMSRALMSGGNGATEGNLAMNTVYTPMDSQQRMLPVARDGGNPPTLTALSAEFVAAAGLPPDTKIYALITQNKQP